jgi:hypothetical protein
MKYMEWMDEKKCLELKVHFCNLNTLLLKWIAHFSLQIDRKIGENMISKNYAFSTKPMKNKEVQFKECQGQIEVLYTE